MLTVYNSDHTENNDNNDSVGVRVGNRIGRGSRRKEEEFFLLPNQTTKNRFKTKTTKSLKVDAGCDEDEFEIMKNELSELKKNMKSFGVVANFKAHIGIITSKTNFFIS
jgi:hypothetical protein